MKKFWIGIACAGVVSLGASVAYASDYVQALLFPVKIEFNGQNKELSQEYTILNYNGHAYVPIRYIVENMGGEISYDGQLNQISIKYAEDQNRFSELNSVKQEGPFSLSLASHKKEYTHDEAINIWAELTYSGSTTIEVQHANPLIVYYIKDDVGNYREMATLDSNTTESITPNQKYKKSFPSGLVPAYNYDKSGLKDYRAFLENFPAPDSLSPGNYEIGVKASFNSNGEEKVIDTSITIAIK
ncbi:stalk domain-containing protein [Paenibacillus residui]|uniref:Stalk domain-containing protein n=1 Tax=Paenibacillus residui TaxID=629724 RepID=A0ABW3DG53_9BACL